MEQFQVNFFGLINVTNAVLPHMRLQRSGTVVFMGSRLVWQAHGPVSIVLWSRFSAGSDPALCRPRPTIWRQKPQCTVCRSVLHR